MATVNGKEILKADLEKRYQSLKAGMGPSPQASTDAQSDIEHLAVLRQMIDDEILLQRAAKLNLTASDEDVNAKITELKAPYTPEQFDQQLKAHNITLDDVKRDERRMLTVTKLMNKEIESKINISQSEIETYFNQHKAEYNFIEPQYHLGQIAVSSMPNPQSRNLQNNKANSDADAHKKILALRQKLQNGEDFGNIAANFSENPNTAQNNGDMGLIPESSLHSDPDVFAAISKLQPGQISDVIPVYDGPGPNHHTVGYAIYKLIGREPAGQRDLSDPRVQQVIRQGLRDARAQLLKNAYSEMLHNDAKVHNYLADQILSRQ
jgi:peptidyl-prolyl cis-trans isomerase SurA